MNAPTTSTDKTNALVFRWYDTSSGHKCLVQIARQLPQGKEKQVVDDLVETARMTQEKFGEDKVGDVICTHMNRLPDCLFYQNGSSLSSPADLVYDPQKGVLHYNLLQGAQRDLPVPKHPEDHLLSPTNRLPKSLEAMGDLFIREGFALGFGKNKAVHVGPGYSFEICPTVAVPG